MSNDEIMQKLEKTCFWNTDSEDSLPCSDDGNCKYSSMDSVKSKMYREGCKYFNSN
jgi:hypothetical protein